MPLDVRLPLLAVILLFACAVVIRDRRRQPARARLSPRDKAAIRRGRALYEHVKATQADRGGVAVGPEHKASLRERRAWSAAEDADDEARTQAFSEELQAIKEDHPVAEHEPDTGEKKLLMSTEALDTMRLDVLREACEYCHKDHEGECPQMIEARGSRDFVVTEAEVVPDPDQQYFEPDEIVDAEIVEDEPDLRPWPAPVDGVVVSGPPAEEPVPSDQFTEVYFEEWQPVLFEAYDGASVVNSVRALYDEAEREHGRNLHLRTMRLKALASA